MKYLMVKTKRLTIACSNAITIITSRKLGARMNLVSVQHTLQRHMINLLVSIDVSFQSFITVALFRTNSI